MNQFPIEEEKKIEPNPVLKAGEVKPEQETALSRTVEIEKAPEGIEGQREREKPDIEERGETETKEQPGTAPPPKTVQTSAAPAKSETLQAVENIMAEDLIEVFKSLDAESRERFKKEGERTATKIELLLQATKVNIKKVLDLIKKWLRFIPHVNRFFLEQEAKIKTDKIISLKRKE
ncbi:MAG: hypothetical protein PHI73_02545 [Patescibacteria group bacterium]|nr:hypothetical protein [Patescibacteria group bacterium]